MLSEAEALAVSISEPLTFIYFSAIIYPRRSPDHVRVLAADVPARRSSSARVGHVVHPAPGKGEVQAGVCHDADQPRSQGGCQHPDVDGEVRRPEEAQAEQPAKQRAPLGGGAPQTKRPRSCGPFPFLEN